jgi:peptidylprolyl isomerase
MKLVWIVSLLALVGCGQPENSTPKATPDDSAAHGTAPPGSHFGTSGTAVGTGGPIQAGSKVTFHFHLIVDGEVMQDSHGREPGVFVQGARQIFPALETALDGLKAGEKKTVKLKPADAFGERMPDAFQTIPRSSFPNADSMKVGDAIGGNANGQRVSAVVQKIDADSITLDMNHQLAGKEVTFEIEIISVE